MKKSVISLLLAVALIVGMLPVVASAATEPTPQIKKASITLEGILNLNFKVASNGVSNMSDYSVRVTFDGETACQEITTPTRDGDLYVYTAKMPAHKLGKSVTIKLLKNGQTDPVQTISDWTVASYLDKVVAQKAAYKNLADAMKNYGAYAAYYAAKEGTAPNVTAVESVTKDQLVGYKHQMKTNNTELKPTAALYVDDSADLIFKFDASAWGTNYKLLIDGEEAETTVSGGKVVASVSEILPQNWTKACNVKVMDESNSTTVFEVDYSVMSYARIQLNKTSGADESLVGLMKAMYLYSSEVTKAMNLSSVVKVALGSIELRDPFILNDGDAYYLYGTGNGKFNVWSSTDLNMWVNEGVCYGTAVADGYYNADIKEAATWAPEVYKYDATDDGVDNPRYFMFATFTHKENYQETAILVADSPVGPFKPYYENSGYVLGSTTRKDCSTLDGTLFIADGTPYMIYCHEWQCSCNSSNNKGTVEYVQLSKDLKSVVGNPEALFSTSSVVSGNDGVTDGCFVYTENGVNYLLWSTNAPNENYTVQYTTLTVNNSGLSTGSTHTSLYTKNGGHGMIFTDMNGQDKLVLHTPNSGGTAHPALFNVSVSNAGLSLEGVRVWNGFGYLEAQLNGTMSYTADSTLFIGDSFFDKDFWTAFDTDLANKDARIFGIGSTTAFDWINYMEAGAFLTGSGTAPRNIVVNIGNNDCYGSYSSLAEADIQAMMSLLKKNYPSTNLYLFSVTPRTNTEYGASDANTQKVNALNTAMQTWCGNNGVTYLNIYSQLNGADKLTDGIHPKAEYYNSVFLTALTSAGCQIADRADAVETLPVHTGEVSFDKYDGSYKLVTGEAFTEQGYTNVEMTVTFKNASWPIQGFALKQGDKVGHFWFGTEGYDSNHIWEKDNNKNDWLDNEYTTAFPFSLYTGQSYKMKLELIEGYLNFYVNEAGAWKVINAAPIDLSKYEICAKDAEKQYFDMSQPFQVGVAGTNGCGGTFTDIAIKQIDPNAPIEITDWSQITDMAGNYKLANSITADAAISEAFTGTIDGNGYTITTNGYPFKVLQGTVKNLTIDLNGTTASGALAIYATNATIEDVTVKTTSGNGKVEAATASGGLVGTATNCYFTRCTNEGVPVTVTGDAAGGIVGYSKHAEWAYNLYTDCSNTGTITANDSTYPAAGGIAGWVNDNAQFVGCSNSGEVKSLSDKQSYAGAGGIVGYVDSTPTVVIKNGKSVGNVTTNGAPGGSLLGAAPSATATLTDNTFGAANNVTLGSKEYTAEYHVYGSVGNLTDGSQQNIYTITYDYAGGTVEGTNPATATQGQEITVIQPTKSGFVFTGWSGAAVVDGKLTVTDNITLTAQWVEVQSNHYIITYEGVEGATNPNSTSVEENTVLTLQDASHPDRKFLGWYFDGQKVTSVTVDKPYTITAKWAYYITDLSALANSSDEFILKENISCSATVGNFSGILDGNGKTITAFVHLFESLNGATVKDLTIDLTGTIDESPLANYANGSTITGVTVKTSDGSGAVVNSYGYCAGGLVSTSYGSNFTGCVNENLPVTVTNNSVGGIVGYTGNDEAYGASTFTNCVNKATITATDGNCPSAGGIVGYTDDNATFTGCSNTGTVTAPVDAANARSCAGGIVGYVGNSAVTVKDSSSTGGNVTTNGAPAGSLVGKATSNLTLTGNIFAAEGKVNGKSAADRIFGTVTNLTSGSQTNTYTITYVLGDGAVNGTGNPATTTHGQTITLADPSRDGYVFNGWQGLDGKTVTVISDLTLTAQWGKAAAIDLSTVITGANASVTLDAGRDYYLNSTLSFAFTGKLNGNGATVVTYAPLFNSLGSGAQISNLTIDLQSNITSNSGVLAGAATGATVTDVTVKTTNNSAINAQHAGGFVDTAIGCTFTRCRNENVNVTTTNDAAGGLVYYTKDNTNYFYGCSNAATITGHNAAGGIVGWGSAGDTFADSDSTHTTNTGSITAAQHAGGIVGIVDTTAATLTNCVNSGAVTGNDKNGNNAGGMIGTANNTTKLTACVNSGKVTGDVGAGSAGGMVGNVASGMSTLTDCVNSGEVLTTKSTGTQYNYGAGGLVGKVSNGSVSISGGSNTGYVHAANACAGGAVGVARPDAANITVNISNFTNGSATDSALGKIAGQTAGGIMGYANGNSVTSTVTITGCTNNGAIAAETSETTYNGGIMGCYEGGASGTTTITNCTNNGNVSGVGSYNGNISGYPLVN